MSPRHGYSKFEENVAEESQESRPDDARQGVVIVDGMVVSKDEVSRVGERILAEAATGLDGYEYLRKMLDVDLRVGQRVLLEERAGTVLPSVGPFHLVSVLFDGEERLAHVCPSTLGFSQSVVELPKGISMLIGAVAFGFSG